MMFKFETSVVRLVMAALLALSSFEGAASETTRTDSSTNFGDLLRDCMKDPASFKAQGISCSSLMDKFQKQSLNSDNCPTAEKDYIKIKGEFEGACGKAGASSNREKSGSVACSEAVNKCQYCGTVKSGEDTPSGESCPEKQKASTSADDIGSGAARLSKATELGGFCPSKLGSVDQDKLQKEYDQLDKSVKELEDKLPKIQQEANDVQSQTEEKIQGIKDEMKHAYDDNAAKVKEAKRARDQKQQEIIQQLTALGNQITQRQNALRQLWVKRTEVNIAFLQSKNKIDLNCSAKAVMQVEQEQNITYSLMKSNNYSRGPLTSLLQNVGISSRQAWQRKAGVYNEWCMVSDATVKSQDEANQVHKLGLDQEQQSEASIGKEIDDLKQQQLQLKNPAACATAQNMQANGEIAGETQMCQAYRQSTEDLNQAQTELNTSLNNLNQKATQAQADGYRKYQAKQTEYAKAERQLTAEKSRFENLKKYMEKVAGNAGSDDPKAYTELMGKYGEFKSAAQNLVSCKTITECNSGNCAYAKNFLDSIHEPATPLKDYTPSDPTPAPDAPQVRRPAEARTPPGPRAAPPAGTAH